MAFIQGNSHCTIEIDDDVVRKISANPEYSPRLERQIAKQKQFAGANRLFFCRTPKILGEKWNDGLYEAQMQYVNGKDFIEFIKHASRDELEMYAQHIDRVIEQNIAASLVKTVPHSVLSDKVRSIESHCDSPALVLFSKFPTDDLEIPVGVCHGDLTLSNILFTHTGIVLIDFLDNFIETPLQDMAKIRQDTRYLWSVQLYSQPHDRVRCGLALRFMDEELDRLFKRHASYVKHYPIFQFVNLARILPYCKTLALREHVERSIQSLVENHV